MSDMYEDEDEIAFTPDEHQHPNTQRYENWEPRPVADPRSATQRQFEDGLLEIIETEGPMRSYRAYQMYAKASGLMKITATTKARLDRTMEVMQNNELIICEQETDEDGIDRSFVRLPEHPVVRLREAGDRSIDDVPPSELAEVILWVRSGDELLGREEIYRAVLAHYGLQKITALARRTLDGVMARYF